MKLAIALLSFALFVAVGQWLRERRHRMRLCGILYRIVNETSGRKGTVSFLTMQMAVNVLGDALGRPKA